MEIAWYAGERLPCWSLAESLSAVSIRNLLSSLIIHGNESLPNSTISSRALAGRGSAWSLRLSLGEQHLKHDADDNNEAEEDGEEGDTILPPNRFTTFYCHIRRGGTGNHLWESPLIAAQRAEAFIIATTTSSSSSSGSEERVFRVDPIDAQVFIARTVSAAANDGVAITKNNSDIFAATDFELRSYSRAAEDLQQQRTRVKSGGEPWSRLEMLKKLSALRSAAERAIRSTVNGTPLTAEGQSALEAIAAGDAEMAELTNDEGDDGEGGFSQ
jgi:hypothetical protein